MSIRGMLRAAEGAIAGTILYVPLLLFPLIGPLLAGLAAGKTAKSDPGKSLLLGFFCGVVGSAIWLFAILPGWRINPEWFYWIVWGIFLLWNLLSILFCTLGSLMGAMIAASQAAVSQIRKNAAFAQRETNPEQQAPTYVVCRACGTSSPDGSASCKDCGSPLSD
jgi:hypothetical protein